MSASITVAVPRNDHDKVAAAASSYSADEVTISTSPPPRKLAYSFDKWTKTTKSGRCENRELSQKSDSLEKILHIYATSNFPLKAQKKDKKNRTKNNHTNQSSPFSTRPSSPWLAENLLEERKIEVANWERQLNASCSTSSRKYLESLSKEWVDSLQWPATIDPCWNSTAVVSRTLVRTAPAAVRPWRGSNQNQSSSLLDDDDNNDNCNSRSGNSPPRARTAETTSTSTSTNRTISYMTMSESLYFNAVPATDLNDIPMDHPNIGNNNDSNGISEQNIPGNLSKSGTMAVLSWDEGKQRGISENETETKEGAAASASPIVSRVVEEGGDNGKPTDSFISSPPLGEEQQQEQQQKQQQYQQQQQRPQSRFPLVSSPDKRKFQNTFSTHSPSSPTMITAAATAARSGNYSNTAGTGGGDWKINLRQTTTTTPLLRPKESPAIRKPINRTAGVFTSSSFPTPSKINADSYIDMDQASSSYKTKNTIANTAITTPLLHPKPLKCRVEGCNKQFSLAFELVAHENRSHFLKGQRPRKTLPLLRLTG
jgi:hypothetical protein